jgi:hypothetical protein
MDCDLVALANEIQHNWMTLAEELNMPKHEIVMLQLAHKTSLDQACAFIRHLPTVGSNALVELHRLCEAPPAYS